MKKKYLNTILKTIQFFAVIHFVILLFMVIFTNNLEYLNIFRILGLNELFPGIEKGELSLILSSAIELAVILFFFRKKASN